MPLFRCEYPLMCAVLLHGFLACSGYLRYEVESLCSRGTLEIRLADNGTMSAGILKATRYISYKIAMDCTISLVAPPKHGVVVSVRRVGFRLTLEGTCKDWIKIVYNDGTSDRTESLCHDVFDLDEAQSFTSSTKDNVVIVNYHTDSDGLDNKTLSDYPGFELTFTAYRCDEPFSRLRKANTFHCENGCYVWEGLKCDGHNNCGDMSDESQDGLAHCSTWSVMILVIIGTGVACIAFISSLSLLVLRKRRRALSQFRMRQRSQSREAIVRSTPT